MELVVNPSYMAEEAHSDKGEGMIAHLAAGAAGVAHMVGH